MVRQMPRRRRALAAAAVMLVLPVLVLLPAEKVAVGAPHGASPLVYLAASGGLLDAFSLAGIDAGTTPLAQSDNLNGYGSPAGEAITADSAYSVVILNTDTSGNLAVIATSTGSVRSAFKVAPGLKAVATDPASSALAYVLTGSGDLYRVDIDTGAVSEVTNLVDDLASEGSSFFLLSAAALAVSSNGTTAYVGASGYLGDGEGEAVIAVPLDAASPHVTAWSQAEPVGTTGVTGLALTPSDNEIFACDHTEVFGLHLPLTETEASFDVVAMQGVDSLTIGPHGKNVYAGVLNANDQAEVEAFGVTAPSAVTRDSLQTVAGYPLSSPNFPPAMAATADGSTLLVTVTFLSDVGTEAPYLFHVTLGNLNSSGGPAMTLGSPVALPAGLHYPLAVAVTPDQAPHASFTASLGLAGSPSSFRAAGSTVKYGSITSYAWNFGDGSTVTTSSDTASHVFATAGTYKVTLVERDSYGTTIPPAFPGTPASWVADGPGQTPYRLSSTLAETAQTVTIRSPTGPHKGKPAPKAGKAPLLTLEPAVGPPGSVVTVTGSRFPDNATVTVEWSTPNASSTAVKVKVKNGGFVTQLFVLCPDLLGPRYALAVSYPKANRPTFLVVATSEEPGGASALPIFRSQGP